MFNKYLKQTHKKFEQKIKNNQKSVLRKPYEFLLSFLRPVYFSKEYLMLKGFKRKPYSQNQSVIFFTVHKSASTFVKNLIFKLEAERLQPIAFSGLLMPDTQEIIFNDEKKMGEILVPTGYVYGPFRSYYNFPGLEKYKIILLLRDPRDVLTSQYFSVVYNHPLGKKMFMEKREKYENYSIDDFVLEMAPSMKKKYAAYIKHLLPRPNILFLKYEDMVYDFDSWLHRLSSFLELKDNEDELQAIIKNTSFKVTENKHNFIRNVTPGDHKNKLAPETILRLNNLFSDELNTLNYKIINTRLSSGIH